MGSDPEPEEEFWAMARRVRRTAEEELAEIEFETERAEEKRHDLTTRGLRAMMEGERWQIMFANRTLDAQVVHIGENYLGFLDRAGNLHDVVNRAILVVSLVGSDPRNGRAPTTFRPATFRARLLSLEEMREVEIGGDGGWSLLGTIESVNADHVVFRERTGQSSIAPITSIGYISRTTATSRRGPGSELRPRPRPQPPA